MDDILQAYVLILRHSFVFYIKKWFCIRAKDEALLEMILSLQTNNEQLDDWTYNTENQNLAEKSNIIK